MNNYDWLKEEINAHKDDWMGECTGAWIQIAEDLLSDIEDLTKENEELKAKLMKQSQVLMELKEENAIIDIKQTRHI